ncbi:MAG: hydrogenase maturation nickel metallochaperone HypA [Cyanobacteriota bacterium]|jgi:hydrogenase nickel incorporation protein HypA/HybF|nr:hydrogenase maturation nickel metallochaperone HypA [Cyanobacteriota bacterium]
MHELSLTEALIDTVLTLAAGQPVQRVVLEIGELAAILPDSMAFCFAACKAHTPLAETVLDIVIQPGRGRCRACGHEQAMEFPYGLCQRCDSPALAIIAGQDLVVQTIVLQSLETEPCVPPVAVPMVPNPPSPI